MKIKNLKFLAERTILFKKVNLLNEFLQDNHRFQNDYEKQLLLDNKFVKIVKTFLCLSIIRYLLLYLFEWSYYQRVLWFDAITLYGLDKTANFCSCMIEVMTLYLFCEMHIKYNKCIDTILHPIIVDRKENYFLSPLFKKVPIRDYLMLVAKECLNQTRLFIVGLGKFLSSS